MITRERMRQELERKQTVAQEVSRRILCRECRELFEPPPPRPGVPRSICPDCARAYRRQLGEKMQAVLRGRRHGARGEEPPRPAARKRERERSERPLKSGQQRDRIARMLRGKLLSPECEWHEQTSDGYRWYDMPGVGEDMQKLNFVLFRRLPVSLRGCWISEEKMAAATAVRDDASEE